MSVLLAVADHGSLSAAARRLKSPLTTVSRKIAELERHIDAQLVNRSSRKACLTDAGRAYVEAARDILIRVEEAEKAAAGEYQVPKGDLVVTAPIVFGRRHVLPVVAQFLQAYPEIDLRLTLGDQLANILDERIDIALRIGNLPDSNLVATRLGQIRRVVYGSPGYLERRQRPQHPLDLIQHDCVTFEGLASSHAWPFVEGKREFTAPVRSRLVVNTAESAIDAAIAGVGLTRVLSYQAAPAVARGDLLPLLEQYEQPPWPVQLVFGPNGQLPLKVRAFLDFATPRLRARLAQTANQ
ncbi:DNA-binding transcriptional LysR family regulator [Ensifer sp. 4252]